MNLVADANYPPPANVPVELYNTALLKHAMHAAAVIGVVGVIGGFMPVMRSGFDWNKTGVKIGLLMSLICAVFVALCVKSFIDARKARTAA